MVKTQKATGIISSVAPFRRYPFIFGGVLTFLYNISYRLTIAAMVK